MDRASPEVIQHDGVVRRRRCNYCSCDFAHDFAPPNQPTCCPSCEERLFPAPWADAARTGDETVAFLVTAHYWTGALEERFGVDGSVHRMTALEMLDAMASLGTCEVVRCSHGFKASFVVTFGK